VFHPPPPLSMFDYSSLFIFQFSWGRSDGPGAYWFMFPGIDKGGAWCSPISSVISCSSRFGAGRGREKLCQLFSVQCGMGWLSMS
jgi:hypothetical protein